ncbi:MAG: hypothetical protein JW821_18970, partial [Deltaproteobacteria bacterium]|nr:hypothetical protein [Deltaproteobacteria bacterium]
ETLSREIERMKPLGEFHPGDLVTLQKEGLWVKIYRCSPEELHLQDVPMSHALVGKTRGGDHVYILALNEEDFSLPFEEFEMPRKGLRDLEGERNEVRRDLADLERRLDGATAYGGGLREALAREEEAIEFTRAAAGLLREGPLSFLRGYCPSEALEGLRAKAGEKGWGIMIEEVSEADDVPTLIRSPRWLRIVRPVFAFMGTHPGYREYDVSFWFLISLSLFFAILVGDGGYGLIFLLGTVFARRRFRRTSGEPFVLLAVFSVATMLWGLLSGTWFGIEGLARIPVLSGLVVPELDSYADNQDFMIRLCFTLGVLHLTAAHGIRGVRALGSLRVLAEAGWICILWFLYGMANHLVLGRPLPGFSIPLLLAGLVLAALFAGPGRPSPRSALLGLGDLPLRVITSFSDLVSYLRLFAVGYATLVVAVSFNDMAASLGGGSPLGILGAGFVLLLGHGMNIALAAMAVLVHGVRLNMLEFSSHVGMTWSGREYRPFGGGH